MEELAAVQVLQVLQILGLERVGSKVDVICIDESLTRIAERPLRLRRTVEFALDTKLKLLRRRLIDAENSLPAPGLKPKVAMCVENRFSFLLLCRQCVKTISHTRDKSLIRHQYKRLNWYSRLTASNP